MIPVAMIRRLLFFFLLLVAAKTDSAYAVGPAEIVANPLTHGAWLYKLHCTRCHGDYGKERPAENYRTADSLEKAVAGKGCRIAWARSTGGSLNPSEITAVSHYMRTWEEHGREPDISPLPDIPRAKAPALAVAGPLTSIPAAAVTGEKEKNVLSPPLLQLIRTNPVARGAWLYTGNCYRCHLSYETARMGRGLQSENLRKIVETGKTSTQMVGFSALAGGKLKNSDIAAIVSYIALWESFGTPLAIAQELLRPPAQDPMGLRPIGLPRFPPITGDRRDGNTLFQVHCSRCHGQDRAGYTGRSLTLPWYVPRPDLFLKSTIKYGIPGSFMPAFSGNAGGVLTPKQIDNLVGFLLTSPSSLSKDIPKHNRNITGY